MSSIPRVQTDNKDVNQLQSNILTQLNPIVKNPLMSGTILTKQSLTTGGNIINHGLNRTLQGWFLVRQRASASIYDTQDNNTNPQQTLLLTSSANVVVDIYVF